MTCNDSLTVCSDKKSSDVNLPHRLLQLSHEYLQLTILLRSCWCDRLQLMAEAESNGREDPAHLCAEGPGKAKEEGLAEMQGMA